MFLHALVGYVELGTDSWIVEIMKPVMRGQAVLLIIYTSILMFTLRFFAGPIVERINPLGLLFVSSLIAFVGLYFLADARSGWLILLMGTVYGIGKTFLWPTMLGVVGEQFPRGGALTMGALGAVGTLSAGFLAGPMIGYQQDYYASTRLNQESPATLERYQANDPKAFLFFPETTALDGSKVAILRDQADVATGEQRTAETSGQITGTEIEAPLNEWWQGAKTFADEDRLHVEDATMYGGRTALKRTSLVPLAMAVGYLLLVIYYRLQGGYRVAQLNT